MNKPILFISGPMKGFPNKNRERFNEIEELAISLGYTVLNPATLPDGLNDEDYLPICLAMLEAADYMFSMCSNGYYHSCAAEQAYAVAQGIHILTNEDELQEYV